MKQVGNFLPSNGLSKPTESTETPSLLTAKHIASLWLKMARIYGHRWTSGFGEADDGTWLTGLRGLAPDDIAAGYQRMIESSQYAWPPSLPEFRSLCFGINDDEIEERAKELVYQKLGSFDYQRLTTRELEKKVSAAVPKAITEHEQARIEWNMQKHAEALGTRSPQQALKDEAHA